MHRAQFHGIYSGMNRFVISCFVALFFFLPGCGGGGGGDEFDPLRGADVDLGADPQAIDVGNRTKVSVYISRIHPDGVVVVLRYSAGALAYVGSSALLDVDGDIVALSPTFGPGNRANWDYVTFYLPRTSFADENSGILSFELRGERRDQDARVEVDEFPHNPLLAPVHEFSLADPDFAAEDIEGIPVQNR